MQVGNEYGRIRLLQLIRRIDMMIGHDCFHVDCTVDQYGCHGQQTEYK